MHSMQFKDKVVVVTGASSGIGEQIAREFAAEGAIVILLARHIEKLVQIQKTIPNSFAVHCDVRYEGDVKKALLVVKRIYGRVDILVNNAGIGRYGPFEKQNIDEMRDQMETNYFGIIHCVKYALPLMEKGSRIINISSIVGKLGIPGMSSYVATKFAVTGLSEVLYYELYKKGIRVHVVYPAGVKTHFFDNKTFKPYLKNLHPGFWVSPRVVAKAVLSAVKHNRTEVYVPRYTKYLIKARALFRSFSRFIERHFYKDKF
jgi:uncharacterized protein